MGNMSIARKMISDVADCGITMCKFQWYSAESLFNDSSKDI